MKIVFANPGECSRIIETCALERIIDQTVKIKTDRSPFSDDENICVVMDKEALTFMIHPNRLIDTAEEPFPVFGPCIFCQKQDGKYTGLTDEQIQKVEKKYHLPEQCFINHEQRIMLWASYNPEEKFPQKRQTGKTKGEER